MNASDVRSFFEATAAEWDTMRLTYYDERVIETMADAIGVDGRQTVLDVGTGTGFVAAGLASRAERVIALDNSPAMLEVARDNLAQLGADNVELREGDLGELPLEDDSMDAAVANMVLHHAQDPAAMIAEMARGPVRIGGSLTAPSRRRYGIRFVRRCWSSTLAGDDAWLSPGPVAAEQGSRAVLVRRGKGGRRREVGMDRWAWSQLEAWMEIRGRLPVGALLCVIHGATAGRGWEQSAARKPLRRAALAAGVRRRFAPHQLRHAHAVEMAYEGELKQCQGGGPPIASGRHLLAARRRAAEGGSAMSR